MSEFGYGRVRQVAVAVWAGYCGLDENEINDDGRWKVFRSGDVDDFGFDQLDESIQI